MDFDMDNMSNRRKWYKGGCTKLLKRSQDLLKDRDTWTKQIAISDDERQPLISSDIRTSSGSLYEMKQEDLYRQLDRMHQQVDIELEAADTSRRLLRERRTRGTHKISANAMEFLATFKTFTDNFSGIVEIVKTVDNQYGGLAWGTLSLFLSVAWLKQEREDEVNRAMQEFSRHSPRLKILEEIYPDEGLQRHIAEMYANIIEFARSATEFYQRGSIRRAILSSNPKDKVLEIIEHIQTGLRDIRLDCEALMQQRLYDLSKQVDALNEQLVRMNSSLEVSRREKIIKHTSKLRDRFAIPAEISSDTLAYKKYQVLLSVEIFKQRSRTSSSPTCLTSSILKEDTVFNEWFEKTESGILILSGQNAAWINTTTLNWLSQAALLTIERLQAEKKDFASVLCQSKSLLAYKDKPLIRAVFAHLAFQLLERRPIDFYQLEAQVSDITSSDAWNSDNEYETLKAGANLLSLALQNYSHDETVYLVLDRIDQCRWAYETEKLRLGVCDVLEILLTLVEDAPCKLKILVVSASTSHTARLRQVIAQRHDERTMGLYFERLNWDQE